MKGNEGFKGNYGQEGSKNTTLNRNVEIDKLREQRVCFIYKEKWQYFHKSKLKARVSMVESCEGESLDQTPGQEEKKLEN